MVLTFKSLLLGSVFRPARFAVGSELPKLEVSDGQPDDGGFVQLRGDGVRQRQHLCQFVKFVIFFAPPGSSGISTFLFAEL